MIIGGRGNHCNVCGACMKDEKHDIPGLVFTELEGCPSVCARCIYEGLTGMRLPWIDAWQERVDDD